jgi:quercetin dioxygenase-like cupin family protein
LLPNAVKIPHLSEGVQTFATSTQKASIRFAQPSNATVVEVHYGPGESSPQHSHPCPVIGYVVHGVYRSQIEGEPEEAYKAGDTFYEAPNGLHVLSANASKTEPAA